MGARDKIVKALMGIKAYHSSPHDYDKFDLSKIGTGEGAQSYGHGLYFAENPAVSGHRGEYWAQFSRRFGADELAADRYLSQHGFDPAKAIAKLESDAAYTGGDYLAKNLGTPNEAKVRSAIAAQQRQLELLRSGKQLGPRTYEVDIKADPAQMLDWDAPLSAQTPHVQTAVEKLLRARSGEDMVARFGTGEELNLTRMPPAERKVTKSCCPSWATRLCLRGSTI